MARDSFLFDWSGRTKRSGFAAIAVPFLAAVAWFVWSWGSGGFDGLVPGVRWPLLAVGVLVLPFHAVLVRRMHDAGLPTALYWLTLVPGLGLLALLAIAVRRSVRVHQPVPSRGRQAAVVGISALAVLLSASAFLTLHRVPGVDMAPTLLPGDVLLVTRWAVGGPAPGDIAVFRHPATGALLVRRIVAGPGASVAMEAGQLVIDGVAVRTQPDGTHEEVYRATGPDRQLPYCANAPVGQGGLCRNARLVETLPGGHRHRILDTRSGPLDNMPSRTVPEGHVFVLGDNRDNATDSRVDARARGVGPVPLAAVVGRVGRVVVSPAAPSVLRIWHWRPGRFMTGVE